MFNNKKKQAAAEQQRAEAEAEAEALRAQLRQVAAKYAELERRMAALVEANAELDLRLGTTGGRLKGVEQNIATLSEHTAAIDERVSNVSVELTNQLVELSRDIETLNERESDSETAADSGDTAATPVAPAVDTEELESRIVERVDAALEDVIDATEHLAAEQARYEIRFRADLADLADQLRRPTTR